MNAPRVFMAILSLAVLCSAGFPGSVSADRAESRALVKEGADLALQNKTEAAIEVMGKAIEADPNNVSAHTRLGFLYLDTGNNDAALASFEEALKLQPRAHGAKTGKGAVLARRGELDAAETVLKDALVLNPDPVRAHYELGLVYEKQGSLDKAIAEFKAGIAKYKQGRH